MPLRAIRFRSHPVSLTHPSTLYLCVLLGSKQNFRSPRLLDRKLNIKLCLHQGISGCCLSLWNASSSACSACTSVLQSWSLPFQWALQSLKNCFRLWRLYLLKVICSLQVTLYLIHGNRVTNMQDVLLLMPLLFFPLPSFPLTL